MIIGLKCPTETYEIDDNIVLATFYFDKEQSDESIEDSRLKEIRKLGLGAWIITQMSSSRFIWLCYVKMWLAKSALFWYWLLWVWKKSGLHGFFVHLFMLLTKKNIQRISLELAS